jgi:hypothetical protein
VLAFERQVVDALASGPGDRRRAVAAWVDGSLADMPEVLRAGVAIESVVLGSWWRTARRRRDARTFVAALSRGRIAPLRQYARLFRSLVLFAELET